MNQLYKILSTAIFLLVFFFVPNNIAAQSEYLIDTKEELENAIIQTGLDTNSNPGNIQLNSFVPTSAPAIDNRNVAVLVYNDSAIDSDLLFLLNSYFKAFVYQSGSVDDDVYNFSSITFYHRIRTVPHPRFAFAEYQNIAGWLVLPIRLPPSHFLKETLFLTFLYPLLQLRPLLHHCIYCLLVIHGCPMLPV